MPRKADDKVAERNREIADSYQTDNVDVQRLANRYGLKALTVKTILKKEGVIVKRTSRSLTARRPLSNLHVRLGAKISSYRSFTRRVGRKDAALELRLSESRLGELEQGFYDPSLSELLRIADWMDVSIPTLVDGVTQRLGS